ncbi:MAG: threonylcarbamoyl-AMP synthase [Bacillota bacterium]|jgi:L-threonylcarbamoyladenylate synthase|nr:threonylcarbamoyl-AMP synthase [Bacillota bacterium]
MENKLNTKIVRIEKNNNAQEIISEAAKIINDGGLVVFPTETVYGIGADALNDDAVDKIFKAKGRPQDNPLIVHISSMDELNNLVSEIPEKAKKLSEAFWPGPLTLILKKSKIMSDKITAGLDTVAVRYPSNEIALQLIKISGKPIAAPSANTSGKPSPTEASHVIEDLMGKVDMIIDGGSTYIGLESTVIDMTSDIPMILRPGGITKEDVESILGECEYDPAIIKSNEKIIPKSPGQKYRHYSPKAEVILYKGSIENIAEKINQDYEEALHQGKHPGIMSTNQTEKYYNSKTTLCMGDRTKLLTISSNLFSCLRKFDEMGVDVIFAEAVEEQGLGKAIMNRVGKAASKTITV